MNEYPTENRPIQIEDIRKRAIAENDSDLIELIDEIEALKKELQSTREIEVVVKRETFEGYSHYPYI